MEEMLAIDLCVCVCGYQVYNDVWVAVVGEELLYEYEARNTKDML